MGTLLLGDGDESHLPKEVLDASPYRETCASEEVKRLGLAK